MYNVIIQTNQGGNYMNKKNAFAVAAVVLVISIASAAFYFMGGGKPEDNKVADNNLPKSIQNVPETPENAQFKIAPSAIGDIVITPASFSELGVSVDSSFLIKAKAEISEDEILARLSVKSGESFKIEKSKSKEADYLLSFNEPLEKEKIYNFQYLEEGKAPLSFAFQTESGLKIISSNIAQDAYAVPVESGIEITFNQELDRESVFEENFRISPEVTGKFIKVGNTYSFIPDRLQYNAEYNITVAKGLKSLEGDVLEEDYSLKFHTTWEYDANGNVFAITGDMRQTYLPSEDVVFEMSVGKEIAAAGIETKIYSIKTKEDYLNSIDKPVNGELEEIIETELIESVQEYSTSYYLSLNKPLEEGYYYISLKTEVGGQTFEAHKLVQVSPLSVYCLSIGGDMLVWVNDTKTGKPAEGANVITDSITAVTDSEGKAILQTKKDNKNAVTEISYGSYKTFIYNNVTYSQKELSINQKYFSYVYTDRAQYKPNDSIDVFGVIKERYSQYKITKNDKVTVKLGDIKEIPVEVDNYGTFNVKIPVSNMKGFSYIYIYLNGERLTETSVNFIEYQKSKYIFDIKLDKPLYMIGEEIGFTINATTFDGTPVGGIAINCSEYPEANCVTDANGTATGKLTVKGGSWWDWKPYYSGLWFSTVSDDDNPQSIYTYFYTMPSDVMLEHKKLSDNSIEFTSSAIDVEKANKYLEKDNNNFDEDVYRGKSIDMSFSIKVTKTTNMLVKVGERYDFINKVKVPSFKYDSKQEDYGVIDVKTVNGKAVITDLPSSTDPLVSYSFDLNMTDKKGGNISYRLYEFDIYKPMYSGKKEYALSFTKKDSNNVYDSYAKMELNETVDLFVEDRSGEEKQVTNGKLLVVNVHNQRVLNSHTGSPQKLPFTFTKDNINMSEMFGAYFDGKYIYPLYPLYIYYGYDERKLDIDISFDKESYKPGEEVAAKIQVKDKDGKNRKALVNLSVVDEAVFGMMDHVPMFLDGFYGSINSYSYDYFVYVSYTPQIYGWGGGAEKGGGGDEYMLRKDFVDNPYFISSETDDNGAITIKFRLPDNITSWRTAVHAITQDNYLGNTHSHAISTLPYNIDVVMADNFVEGDDFAVLIKSFGNEFKFNDTEVKYAVEILNKDNSIVYNGEKTSKTYADFNAGKLPKGEYTVRVYGEAGEFKDAMEKTVNVSDVNNILPINATALISDENLKLPGYDIIGSPIKMEFSNGEISDFINVLKDCMNFTSNRTDYTAATAFGQDFLKGVRYYGGDENPYESVYLNAKGSIDDVYGVSELVYGEKEPLYTARFAASFPEIVSFDSILRYINEETQMYGSNGLVPKEFTESRQETLRAAGYLAHAAGQKSVLLEIYKQIEIIENDGNQQKFTTDYYENLRVMFYAAALCALGDDVMASSLMEKYGSPKLNLSDVDEKEEELRYEYIKTMQLFVNTTIAPDKAFDYLINKKPNKFVSDVCEKINFIRKAFPAGGVKSEISISLNGKTESIKLTNFETRFIEISKEQYETLNIKQISGKTQTWLSFNGSPANLDESLKQIKITKNIEKSDFSENMYKVTLTIEPPGNEKLYSYTIRDRVPSNMRYTGTNRPMFEDGSYYFIDNTEKQFLNIDVSDMLNRSTYEVTYHLIKVNDSEAVEGQAYVSGYNFKTDKIWGATQ